MNVIWTALCCRNLIPEFNKINVIKKLLHVKYNFAAIPVLDLAYIVFTIEASCSEWVVIFIFYFYIFDVLMYELYNKIK